MKSSFFDFFVLIILFFPKIYSQETNDSLAEHSVTKGFAVTDNADNVLFKVTDEELSSSGITTNYYGNPRDVSNPNKSVYDRISQVFYVDNTASGSYTGKSWANAWNPTAGWDSSATNPYGINWSIIQPGDTIYISGGASSKDYTSSSYFLPKANGTYKDYIYIVKGQDAGHNGIAIIDRIGAMNGISSAGHISDTSLIHNHCIEFNGFQVNQYIAHQDEVQTNNFVANGYHLRFKNITSDDVYADKFFDFTGHPRYIEIIDCHLRQRPSSDNQTDLIWVRGDADYTGGGLWADSIYIKGCTIIGTNQSASPHTDGLQTFTAKNIWIENNKFYVANNKSNFTQILYNEEVSGKIFVLNNIFYIAAPNASSPEIALSRNYTYRTITPDADSIYFYDNTVVAYNTGGRTPSIERATQISMGNNIFINTATGDTHIQIYTMNTETVSNYNVIYSPNMTRKVYRLGSYYTLANWQATGRDVNSITTQPTFTSFDWTFSQTEAIYLNYNFNIPSPKSGINFSASLGGYTYTSDGKMGAVIPQITDPTDILDTLNFTIIKDFNLYQNYPNPFNPVTTIRYQLPKDSKVVLRIYDILGSGIETLVNEEKPIGTYEINLNGTNLPSGIYFYKISTPEYSTTKKMILLK